MKVEGKRISPIRVLVVDDSAVMRALLRTTLAACPDVELAGMAADGAAGMEAIERLRPDLVLLDIEMPVMNGLETLEAIRLRRLPVKVMMCSTLTRRGAGITLEALARGASDYIAKPAAQHGVSEGVDVLRREILPKIRALFSAPESTKFIPNSSRPAAFSGSKVVVVGVSTGGPSTLEKLLPALPADFPAPVLIAQHMPALFTAILAERLNRLCRISVREALPGEVLRRGNAYIARGDRHMRTVGSATHCALHLTQGESEHCCRPSVDELFRSAAAVYGASVLAVVLTGMGSDGLEGCRAIGAAGGRILVQDQETSAVWGMPGAVARAGLANQVLPLHALAAEMTRLTVRSEGNSAA